MKTVNIETDSEELTIQINEDRVLGSGRGSDVHLVEVKVSDNLESILVAEKRYELTSGIKSLLTKSIYNLLFQAPFPYSQNYNAIRSTYFRRKTLKILTDYWRIEDPDMPIVSDAIYTRWDDELLNFNLGTEYIKGRPVLPKEMDSLVEIMGKLNTKLFNIGFIGVAWQTEPASKWTGVATQNFLKKDANWYWVDMESGVFSLGLKYLKKGILFDDVDFDVLSNYIHENNQFIQKGIGEEKTQQLEKYIEKLEHHTTAWKDSEIAILRNKTKLFDSNFRHKIQIEYAIQKVRNKLIDETTAKNIQENFAKYALRSLGAGIQDFFITGAKRYVAKRIYEWKDRLTEEKAEHLFSYLEDYKTKDYLQDVGAQIFSALLSIPIINFPLAGGLSIYAHYSETPELFIPAVILAFPSSIFRSLYSSIRFLTDKTRKASHFVAATLGAIPTLGHLAYYIPQGLVIGKKYPEIGEIGRFLFYHDIISNAGKFTPIFGGENTRLWNTMLEKTGYHSWIEN